MEVAMVEMVEAVAMVVEVTPKGVANLRVLVVGEEELREEEPKDPRRCPR